MTTDSSADSKTIDLLELRRLHWEGRWQSEGFSPPWAGRGISREIEISVREGWVPAKGTVLDIGCGLGDVAAWFAKNGYETLGCDIAEAAVSQARARHPAAGLPLEFMTLDICNSPPPGRVFDILVDRGCLHQIPLPLIPHYVNNLAAASSPNARMLLFIKAFRGERPIGDPLETRQHLQFVAKAFSGHFRIESYALTDLAPANSTLARKKMPGMFFRLVRAVGAMPG